MSSKAPTKKEPKKSKAQEKPEQPEVTELKSDDIMFILDALTATVLDYSNQIKELQEALARKRKPTRNSKVQIKDKQTGKTYPSNTFIFGLNCPGSSRRIIFRMGSVRLA